MFKLAIKESIESETGEIKIFAKSNNHLLSQSSFQHVRSNLERRVAIQHLKCHSKSS
jgi:hypothetical protein